MEITLDSIRDIKLYQSKKGYRFSVDALLLYDFVNLKRAETIADIGAGSGILGILLAKKYPNAQVTLFEIQDTLVMLSQKNISLNNLKERIKVTQCDVRRLPNSSFAPHQYDLAVSNPPFRRVRSGRISRTQEEAIARHEIMLRFPELVEVAFFLLKPKGRFCIIYHPYRLSELVEHLKKKHLQPKRLRFVHSHSSSEAKMVLIEAVKGGREGIKVEKPLSLYKKDGSYTDEMMELYNPS